MTLGKSSVKSRNIATNAVTSSKVKNGSLLAKDFKTGQLPQGAKGDRGPAGAAGSDGAPGATGQKGDSATALWASVNGDGTLRRGSGVVKSERYPFASPTGQYLLTFDRDVSKCAWSGTLANHESGVTQDRTINLFGFSNEASARQIGVKADGGASDFSFDVAVNC